MWVGDQRHAPAALPLGKTGTPCTRGWVGPRAGMAEFKKYRLYGVSIPGPSKQ
jgi:hypothetical protein